MQPLSISIIELAPSVEDKDRLRAQFKWPHTEIKGIEREGNSVLIAVKTDTTQFRPHQKEEGGADHENTTNKA